MSDPAHDDNYSVFVVNHYPPTEGIEWKADTNRISPHTDETLLTLLFTSPGEQGVTHDLGHTAVCMHGCHPLRPACHAQQQ